MQSTRAIGTGRVGPRQSSQKNPFAAQQKDNFPMVNHFQQQQQEQSIGQTDQYYDVINVPAVIPPRPFFDGRPNLHDRLNRHRQPMPSKPENTYDATVNNNNQASENASIAVSY